MTPVGELLLAFNDRELAAFALGHLVAQGRHDNTARDEIPERFAAAELRKREASHG